MKERKNKYMHLAEFADKVGVSTKTIKNYQKKGLIQDKRNPINNYRLFSMEDLKIFNQVQIKK